MPRNADQIDGPFRDRSNSNISNSGSFHGDGSDPTDNKQTLLSAEELSDLIVGRYEYIGSIQSGKSLFYCLLGIRLVRA